MKVKCLLFMAIVARGWVRGETPSPAPHITPDVFASREAAEGYAKKLFAGGAVEVLRVRKKDVLVFYVYGSGVPDVTIAAYRFTKGKWRRAAEIESANGGVHHAVVRDGAIIVVTDRSSAERVLLRANETEG
jgi:hypothetical protein